MFTAPDCKIAPALLKKSATFSAPCVLIEFPTASAAKRRLKVAKWSEAKLVEETAKELAILFPIRLWSTQRGNLVKTWKEMSEGDGSERAGYRYKARCVLKRLYLLEGERK